LKKPVKNLTLKSSFGIDYLTTTKEIYKEATASDISEMIKMLLI
jgi:hypothetical protein